MIFDHLDYFSLTNCMGVNRFFHEAVNLYAFLTDAMFRDNFSAALDVIDLDNICIHPAFAAMSFECVPELEYVEFLNPRTWSPTPLEVTGAIDEFATVPHVAHVRLQVHDWPPFRVADRRGVTVRMIMKAMCRYFRDPVRVAAMGHRTRWTGWNVITTYRRGRLLLRATEWET